MNWVMNLPSSLTLSVRTALTPIRGADHIATMVTRMTATVVQLIVMWKYHRIVETVLWKPAKNATMESPILIQNPMLAEPTVKLRIVETASPTPMKNAMMAIPMTMALASAIAQMQNAVMGIFW